MSEWINSLMKRKSKGGPDETPTAKKLKRFMVSLPKEKPAPQIRPSQLMRPANILAGDATRQVPKHLSISVTGCGLCGEAFLKKKRKKDRETKKMFHLTCWEERNCHFCEFASFKLPSVDCTCGHAVHTSCLTQATKQAGGLYIHKEGVNNNHVVVSDRMAGTVYQFYKETSSPMKRKSEGGPDETPTAKKNPKKKRARDEGGDDEAIYETKKSLLTVPASTPSVGINEERYYRFMSILNKCFMVKNQAQDLEMSVITAFFKKEERKKPFRDVEIDTCIKKMEEENKVMLADQTLFMI